jgi:HAD superfamily hydrolase (TIGR01450 family)
VPLTPAITRYDHVLLDLDGCLWVGEDPVDGATAAVAALREAGKGIGYLSGALHYAPEELVRKLWRLGFQASLAEIVTPGAALQFMLADQRGGGAAFVIGPQALVDHVAAAGLRIVNNTEFATRADVVVVGVHDRFDFRELRIATQAVLRGAELIGLSRDDIVPGADGPSPGAGAILAAVETASGRRAVHTIGRPQPDMYDVARDRLGAGRYLAVGHRLDVDVAGARRAGIDAALVGAERSEVPAGDDPAPTHVADSLAHLVLG